MEKILSILFFYFVYSNVEVFALPKRTTESFIMHYSEDRRIIPVRVELNMEQKLEHVSSIGGETLYDFNIGKVAYKDINSSQCFISDIVEETLEGDRRKLKNLKNGIIRGFYMPTFTIEEELTNETHILKICGNILTKFCKGNTISLVTRQNRRTKRDTSGDRGQFAHHSYGHYGHQTNNYAHYGHETRVTGTVGKDDQIQSHKVSQTQVRSEGSQVYPRPGLINGHQVYTRDSKIDGSSPQSRQFHPQLTPMAPTHQETFGVNGRNLGTRGSGQFSLQSTHEGGYQLNLPLGLKAGNKYQGGVQSIGQYGIGRPQSQIGTDYHKYPDTIHSATYQPPSQTGFGQPSYSIAPQYRGTISEAQLGQGIPGSPVRGVDMTSKPIYTGFSAPIAPTFTSDGRIKPQAGAPGRQTSDMQTELRAITTDYGRQLDLGHSSQDREHTEKRIMPNGQLIPTRTGLPELTPTFLHPSPSIPSPLNMPTIQMPGMHDALGVHEHSSIGMPRTITTTHDMHPRPSIPTPNVYIPIYQPGISMPSVQVPGGIIQRPERISNTLPGTETIDMQPITGIPRPNYQSPSIHTDLRYQQQYMPSGLMRGREDLQVPSTRYPTGYGIDRDVKTESYVPILRPPSYPSSIDTVAPGITQTSPLTPASSVPSFPYLTPQEILSRSDNTFRNGMRFPGSTYPQRYITGQEYPRRDTSSHMQETPSYIRKIPTAETGLRDSQFLDRGTGAIPTEYISGYQTPIALSQSEKIPGSIYGLSSSRGIHSELSTPGSRRILNDQTVFESSQPFGRDSASSQTQLQAGLEESAAEASAAGQYKGLGSQTQVQGGYVGNGSFSAQAQSGFTGGIVQSQVKGNEKGGLSGSSSQIERVGSAQSQVQVRQPSGSASSSAQGIFTGGMTQVQAQSGKLGGSAGAQSQSTGLSTSNAQVNIGGKDANEQERFKGTISASVQGSHSMGQSQTQLQGGYDSGRTYVATAQGGFDSSTGFQPYASPVGSLSSLSNQTGVGRHMSGVSSTGFRIPTESGIIIEKETSQGTRLSSSDQIRQGSTVYTDRSSTIPDSLLQTGLPSPVISPQESSISSDLPTVKPTAWWHPTQEVQPALHRSFTQSAHRYPYPSYQTQPTGVPTAERNIPPTHDFTGYDQRNILSSGTMLGPQQTRGSEIPRAIQPTAFLPGSIAPGFQPSVRGSSMLTPGLIPHDLEYPQSSIPRATDQQSNYTAEVPVSYTNLISQPSSLGSQLEPSLPMHHVPQVQIGHQRPQISQPRFSMIPSPKQPQGMSVLTGPDGSHSIDVKPSILPPSLISGQSQTQPEQSQVSPPKSQISPISKVTVPTISTPSLTTENTLEFPGVSEPDKRNCCEALRALKRRCCERTPQQDRTSCCKSSQDDIFDFSSENGLDGIKEPCKVVKAICYIVYKPVGKARVCKPTDTNAC